MYRHHYLTEKLRAVRLYESGLSSEMIGRELGIDSREIRRWLAKYQRFGVLGFEKQPYTHATPDFKALVVRSVLEKSLSCDAAVLKYGVSRSSVRCWIKHVREQGYDSLHATKPRGRPPKDMERSKKKEPQTELAKLQARLEYLEAENALLKKVKAFVEQRDAQLRKLGRKPSKD